LRTGFVWLAEEWGLSVEVYGLSVKLKFVARVLRHVAVYFGRRWRGVIGGVGLSCSVANLFH